MKTLLMDDVVYNDDSTSENTLLSELNLNK